MDFVSLFWLTWDHMEVKISNIYDSTISRITKCEISCESAAPRAK